MPCTEINIFIRTCDTIVISDYCWFSYSILLEDYNVCTLLWTKVLGLTVELDVLLFTWFEKKLHDVISRSCLLYTRQDLKQSAVVL